MMFINDQYQRFKTSIKPSILLNIIILSSNMKTTQAVLALLGTLLLSAQALKDQSCAYKKFPIFAGGYKKELVNTMTVDNATNNIYVGGQTESSNFAPAENPHGFVYAVSQDGDWLWGQFFYNVSYAVSSIDGLVFSQNNNFLTCLGQANNKPIIMNLNKQKGQIQKFYTLDPTDVNTKVSYLTSQAIYMEEKAPEDNNTYFYISFLQRISDIRRVHIVKFAAADMKIQWHMSRAGYGGPSVYNANDDDRATLMAFDTNIRREFYVFGRFWNGQPALVANVANPLYMKESRAIRINKIDGKFLHFLKFNDQAEVLAYVHPQNTNLFLGCGKYTGTTYQPGVTYFKITNDGQQLFYRTLDMTGGECKGLTYDYEKSQGTLLVTSSDDSLRVVNKVASSYTGNYQDVFLIVVADSGQVVRAQQVSFNPSDLSFPADVNLGINALRRIGNYYAFAGYATGFGTQYHSEKFTDSLPNTFVMKLLFDKSTNYQCIFEGAVRSLDFITVKDLEGTSKIERLDAQTPDQTSQIVSYSNYFKVYSSPYSGAFDLLDTMYIPRPCASAAANLTQMDYFYGQYKKSYNFRNEPSYKTRAVNVFSQMNAEKEFVFQNGSSAENFAWLDSGDLNNQTTVWVQTNEESLVGTQRTVLRGCDSMGKLLEINFYVNVTSNSAPEFTEDIQTQWNLNVGDNINYKLPPFKDPEGNDVGEVYINTMENQEFPPFINFTMMNTTTPALIMTPNNLRYQGRTYYFSVVLKEKHSDVMMNVYYMTVKILGDPLDEDDLRPPNKTEVNITITSLNYKSQGQLKFSMPVNTDLFTPAKKKQFHELFYIFVKTVDKKEEVIRNINFKVINDQTVNFTIQFQNPYMYGLLNKKSDNLIFKCKNCSNDTIVGYLVQNVTNQTIRLINSENSTCQIRVGMQFDFNDEWMTYYRSLAVYLYYIMITIILVQFFVLMWRNVTFLPLWTLIEYMQLIAFMPLYNFKLIPYLYDAFKPMLVGHLILFNNSIFFKEMSDDYFNINYEYYWLPIAKLIQSLINILLLFAVMVFVNIVFFVMSYSCKTGTFGEFVKRKLSQFKFNAYIRFYMLAYFDFTFFSIMKILDGKNTSTTRKVATFFSYAFFVTSIIVPLFFLALLLRRFGVLEQKDGRSKFSTLITKIDKGSKWRVFQPILYFLRRAATAALLCLPINNQYIFLQYIFILVTSHIYILYLVATKPYQTPVFNAYMLANETFYSALIILIFIFSDATPQLNIKVIAGAALITSIFLLVLANIIFIGYIIWKGRDRLKEAAKEAKAKRIEEEEKERQEELERQEKKRKEEEEFSKLPDDTTNNITMNEQTNKTTDMNANTTMAALDKGKSKAAMNKAKANVDDVVNGPYTTAKKGTTPTEPDTEQKFMKKTGAAAKGKVSADDKSSGDSDPNKGPVIKK